MPIQKNLLPRQFFQPSCPSGGSFYACTTGTNFVGCCTSTSACASGCSDGSLEPASFNPSYYGQFQDQECPTGSRWYTCSATTPPFMGCCKSNPCSQDGCPVGDVTAGFLSSNPKVAADFAGANGFSAAASSSVASATSSATSSSSSATSSSSSATSSTISIPSSSSQSTSSSTSPTSNPLSTLPTPSPSPTPIGTIVGAAIGGAAFLLLLIAVILFFCRRRKTHDGAPSRLNWDFKPDEATTNVQPTPMYATQPKNDQALPSPPTPAPQYAPQPTTPTPAYPSSSPPPPSSPAPQYSPPHPELEMDAQQLAYPGPHEMGTDTGLTGQGGGGGWSGRGTGLGLGFGGSGG